MKTVTQHIRDHIVQQLGLDIRIIPPGSGVPGDGATEFGNKGDILEEILDHQVDWGFLTEVAKKAVIGWYRYGNNRDPKGKRHDHLARIELELARFRATGNTERLEEIAIYAMLEVIKGPLGRGSLPPKMYHREEVDDVEGDPSLHAKELEKEVQLATTGVLGELHEQRQRDIDSGRIREYDPTQDDNVPPFLRK